MRLGRCFLTFIPIPTAIRISPLMTEPLFHRSLPHPAPCRLQRCTNTDIHGYDRIVIGLLVKFSTTCFWGIFCACQHHSVDNTRRHPPAATCEVKPFKTLSIQPSTQRFARDDGIYPDNIGCTRYLARYEIDNSEIPLSQPHRPLISAAERRVSATVL